MRRLLAIASVVSTAAALSACGASGDAENETSGDSVAYTPGPGIASRLATAEARSVTESGWSYYPEGSFVSWGAVITNTGVDLSNVEIVATALDASGIEIVSNEQSVFRLAHGITVVGGTFTEASAIADVQVTIDPTDLEPWDHSHSPVTGAVTTQTQLQGGGTSFTLSVDITSTLPFQIKAGTKFYCLFRSSDGTIVGGGRGYLPAIIPAGGQASMALQNPADGIVVPDSTMTVEVSIDASEVP